MFAHNPLTAFLSYCAAQAQLVADELSAFDDTVPHNKWDEAEIQLALWLSEGSITETQHDLWLEQIALFEEVEQG